MANVPHLSSPDPYDTGWCLPRSGDETLGYWTAFWLPVRKTRPQTYGPLQLGLVSSLWKNVSEHTPSLWNRIAVDMDRMDGKNTSTTLHKLSERLSRSGALPLDIGVTSREWNQSSNPKSKPYLVLSKLLLHAPRFRSVSFFLTTDILLPLGYYKHSSPKLTHFHIINSDGAVGLDHLDLKTTWPSLTHLTLEYLQFGSLSVSYSNLTYLKLTFVPISRPWKTIQDAKMLTHLIMHHCWFGRASGSPTGSEATITLHNLKHFEYIPALPVAQEDLLEVLITPSLNDFVMTDDANRPGYHIDALASHSFLSSCANSLRRLVLVGVERERPLDCDILVNTLASLSSLENLEIGLANMPHSYFSPLLTRLTTTAGTGVGDPTFLPKLRTLQFNSLNGLFWPLIPGIFHRAESLDQRPLRQLIIKKMTAVNAESLTIDIIDQLNDLMDDGIDMQFYDEEGERIIRRESARG
ncbi:hypothetical protein D9619_008399 [Psilocybe cf. subviscida]|uniref:F-box domain-containing protein n=1 Tax=Psilocybe cf. subviscida TaxID=2480587 RepID=A0A8H5F109_9AGAR|nr:hypothetical protein D9619_008399 [Psilocybe cf. subviscida]